MSRWMPCRSCAGGLIRRGYRLDLLARRLLDADDRGAGCGVAGRWLLMQLNHHIISDHTTQDVLLQEVHAHLAGEQDRLPAPVPFRNFVAQSRLGGMSAAEHEAFFTRMLSGVEEPVDPVRVAGCAGGRVWAIAEARITLEAGLARRMRECARAANVSVASLCHLAYARMLACLSGQHKVVFGTVLFGRMQGREGIERALGVFINTLPICIEITEQGVAESLRQTHALLAELLMHEHASLALAQRCSAVPPPTPLFSALFNYRHGSAPRLMAEQTSQGWRTEYSQARTNYPFSVSVDDFGERFRLGARVSAGIDPQRVCAWYSVHTVLGDLVEALEQAPHTPLSRIEVLPSSERHQLLEQWNDTAVEYPQDRCIHELFEEQVERTPQAVAVTYEGERLTYTELNEQANRLAHYLRSPLGVASSRTQCGWRSAWSARRR